MCAHQDDVASTEQYDMVTFGETMVRLAADRGNRLEEADALTLSVGGTESNVAVALARLGRRVAWLSVLADNPLGRRVEGDLRRHGVDTSHVIWSQHDRAGVYYIDPGTPPRPTSVHYDRVNSAVALVDPDAVDFGVVARSRSVHLTGITPALSHGCAEVCARLAGAAGDVGVPLILDINYRSKLWSPDDAAQGLARLMQRATLLLCGSGDAATIWGLRGAPDEVARGLLDRSGAEVVVLTLASEGAICVTRSGDLLHQPAVPVTIVDPVGAGDAFAAGFLSRWLDDRSDLASALKAGVCLAALKMTMHGDLAIISPAELDAVIALAGHPSTDIVR